MIGRATEMEQLKRKIIEVGERVMHERLMKSNRDIVFRELPPEPQKPERAKPGSNRVHFSVYPENGVASCGNRAARYFSANWAKVNCYACLKPKLHAFNVLWDKPLEAMEHRKAVKRLAEVYKIKRKKEEPFKDFEIRVDRESSAIFQREEAKEQQKRLNDLNCLSFTTLPLNQRIIQFPIKVNELGSQDDDEYLYNFSEIALDKERYIRLLRELRVVIELRLHNIQKRGEKDK
jgi:hypothetical protein